MARARRAAAAGETELGADADLTALLDRARRRNAGLEAAFLRWVEALERVPQATTLPPPRVTLAAYLSEIETRVGPVQARAGLTQPVPWFGKLDARGELALHAAEEAREHVEAARLDLEHRVRDAWFEYAWLEQAVGIAEGHRELLVHWEGVAQSRLASGSGSHSDVIRAQIELGKLEDRLLTLRDLRRPLEARLNAALNRAADAPLPRPSVPLAEPAAAPYEAALRDGLASSSPRLRAMEHRVEAARVAVELADKAFYPDFLVGAEYSLIGPAEAPGVSGSGGDALALTLGLELPVWRGSYRAGQREAEARLRAARKEREEAWRALSAELELALYEFRDADRRAALFRGSLIPKGEESVQTLDTAYQSGDEGFLDLIDAERALLEFQLQAARAEADRAQALAAIERITGVSLKPSEAGAATGAEDGR